ncbi:type I 3-dehydroquinate dehydratase [Clostridium aminobutyricum]|uniref:3-dehydroquinate dehydratase n=1 Tax=Clostridium aminobutyricum TaxID=33953 RepID=A0A939DAP8_CLOAM|nr:type I 3-dehydroquinate dehydratase [Clostridium aminobutyricum]MBN7774489.1 type I 3-dehydroquinate dehydratase [Clostridium aminobutyricum]
MNIVQVRNIKLGEGLPKICVPIVGSTKEEILQQAEEIVKLDIDIIEWRADWFDGVFDAEAVHEVLCALRKLLEETPLLFTFRTAKEGGEKEISSSDYLDLNRKVAGTTLADLIDVEAFFEEETVRTLIKLAHEKGVKVVASNHDFEKTPVKEEIINRLRKMQELGADLPKLAVMPQCKQDVLTLLSATLEMHEKYADRPIITMSMADDGAISRMVGEIFGSALTFGSAKKASAPGQWEVSELKQVLEIIHNRLKG